MKNLAVIIVAGGSGQRMEGDFPKQFMLLGGKPMLMHSIERFAQAFPLTRIIVAMNKSYLDHWEKLLKKYSFDIPHSVTPGGARRFDSVFNALAKIGNADVVAIHDGVRPLVSVELIKRTVYDGMEYGAAIPVVKPIDSMRRIEGMGSVIVDREEFRLVQTPQVFKSDIIINAYAQTFTDEFTDDASVVEASGVNIYLCEGSYSNIKITFPADLAIAETLMEHELKTQSV